MNQTSNASEPAVVRGPRILNIRPVDAEFLAVIRPRAWLYGDHYQRGMLTATTSAGGIGKSSIQMVEAISMCLGLDLFTPDRSPLPTGPLRVWLHNGEDPIDEVKRRIDAVLRYFGYAADDLGGRLHVTSGRDERVVMVKEVRGEATIIEETRANVVATIVSCAIDVLVLDPFISTHEVSENSNRSIELVAHVWRCIAEETRTAIELAHHHRKPAPGSESSGDEMRGASSLRDALRSARTIGVMSKSEAKKAGVAPDDAPSYIWMSFNKANMSPRSQDKRWFKFVGVDLQNAAPPYQSDQVGVATAWELPTPDTRLPATTVQNALQAISKAHAEDRRFSKASTGWVGVIVANALGLDLTRPAHATHVSMVILALEKQGLIRRNKFQCARQGRLVPVYEAAERSQSAS